MDCKNCLKLEAELAAIRRAFEPIVALLKPKGVDALAPVLEPPKRPHATPNRRMSHNENFERRTLKQVREEIRREDAEKERAKAALEKSSYNRRPMAEGPEEETYFCKQCDGYWKAAGIDGTGFCKHKRPKRTPTPPGKVGGTQGGTAQPRVVNMVTSEFYESLQTSYDIQDAHYDVIPRGLDVAQILLGEVEEDQE